jgi:hypothetical protein
MKKLNFLSLIIILLVFFTAPNNLFANYKENVKEGDNGKGKKPVLQKTSANPTQSLLNCNNATMWVTDAGYHDWVVASSWNGAYPNGQALGAIFTQGIVWGGQVNDGGSQLIRVGGNTYGSGTAGITRLFRVRSDYQKADLKNDAATFNDIPIASVTDADVAAIKAQYLLDWTEWPVSEGAPYENRDGVPGYQPDPQGRTDDPVDTSKHFDIPGIPGATQTIFVKYDDSQSTSLFGANPIGMEVSEVYWAYAASGPLANVIFDKVTLVYKGLPSSAANSVIDSMFIAQMSDPDVGTSSDDFAGCDTVLNLGYAYTSKTSDATYAGANLPPPAAGYDYLQGVSQFTGNPEDSAIFDLKWRKGYKYVNSVPMSSFAYFASGGSWSDPTEGSYGDGALCMYNLMRGVQPRPPYPSAPPFPEDVADKGSSGGVYLLTGDPVTGTGKIDGVQDGPGDRRILPINGPFTMNLGDTAQVVVALVYGMGVNNLSSISVLKFNDASAQFAYDQLFNVPLMPTPAVTYEELNGKISTYWNNTPSEQNSTEAQDHGPYKFQAYAVYQLPAGSKDVSTGTRIATFDVVDGISFMQEKVLDQSTGIVYTRPLIPLNNVDGISRTFIFDHDYINNKALINGQSYTFAITSIGYNDDPGLPQFILESAPFILNVVPQSANPGVTISSAVGDTVKVTHTTGHSDGAVIPLVVDPKATTGHNYEVTFAADATWTLTDVTTGTVKLTGQSNQSGDNTYTVVDGLQVKVSGPADAINNISYSGTRWVTGVNWGGAQFFGGLDLGEFFFGSDVTPDKYFPVEVKWTDNPVMSEANGWSQGAAMLQSAGYAVQGKGWMPFQAFDISDPANPRQINVSFRYNNATPTKLQWDMSWDGTQYTDLTYGGRNYTFFQTTSYDPDYYVTTHPELDPTYNDVLYALWPAPRGTHPYLEAPWTLDIVPNYINTTVDVFSFTAPAAMTSSNDLAKTDVEKINVFPNPYYGYQYRETSPTSKYVTFNHLPDNAIIRIFDLSGVLVKTINHVSTSGQFDTWNLANDNNYPVASGIYIVYVDMPDLGTTKILKLAIIQEQQMLKVY